MLRGLFRKSATAAPEVDVTSIRMVCRQQFLSSKRFWAFGNITLTREMKIVIGAHACLLVLHLPKFGLYPRTAEVIVYPGCFGD